MPPGAAADRTTDSAAMLPLAVDGEEVAEAVAVPAARPWGTTEAGLAVEGLAVVPGDAAAAATGDSAVNAPAAGAVAGAGGAAAPPVPAEERAALGAAAALPAPLLLPVDDAAREGSGTCVEQ